MTLVCGDPETFTVPNPPDTITMFHVVEHLPRPVGVLARLRALAHQGTRLVVEVPILGEGRHGGRERLLLGPARDPLQPREPEERPRPRRLARRRVGRAGRLQRLPRPRRARGKRRARPSRIPRMRAPRTITWPGATRRSRTWSARSRPWPTPRGSPSGAPGRTPRCSTSRTSPSRRRPPAATCWWTATTRSRGRSWRGLEIHPHHDARRLALAGVPLLVSSYGSQEEMADAALALGVPARHIVRLYRQVRVY